MNKGKSQVLLFQVILLDQNIKFYVNKSSMKIFVYFTFFEIKKSFFAKNYLNNIIC